MARYLEQKRDTELFVSGSLEELLPEDSVARAIWAALSQLDFGAYDALHTNDAVGRWAVNPRCLAGVWMLALLRGVTSSLRVTALCHQDIEFRWLLGDSPVQKSTLCEFRKRHLEELVSLITQTLGALGRHGLLPGEGMGVDGSIVRAASSRHSVKSRKRLESRQSRLETLVREKLWQEDGEGPSAEAQALERRRQRVERALQAMDSRGLFGAEDRLTVTEPDATLKRQKDGSFAPGYNAQVVTDLASGAILHAEIVDAGNDSGQLQPQFERAQAVLDELGMAPEAGAMPSLTADGGYHDVRQLDALEERGVRCFVPEDRDAHRTPPGVSSAYRAEAFGYDEATDTMRCPQGQTLKWRKLNNDRTSAVYQACARVCHSCPAKPQCCPKTKEGRSINRSLYKATLDRVSCRVNGQEGRRHKKVRSVACEGAFARLKGLLHWPRCRMWDRAGAEMELRWRQFAYNLMLLARIWKPITGMAEANG